MHRSRLPEKNMTEQILKIAQNLIKDIDGAKMEERTNDVFVAYTVMAGNKGANIQITLNPRYAILSATQEYDYQVREKGRMEFNDGAIEKYAGYQVFGEGQKFTVSKRFLYSGSVSEKEILKELESFHSVVYQAIADYESKCIDFLIRLDEAKGPTEYNPEVIPTATAQEYPDEERTYDETLINDFMKSQNKYCKDSFYQMAKKYNAKVIRKPENDQERYFCTGPEDAQMKVSYEVGQETIVFEGWRRMEESSAYLAISDIIQMYPDMEASFENGGLKLLQYVIPDKYMPEMLQETADNIMKALDFTEKAQNEPEQEVDFLQMATGIQEVLENKMATLKAAEDAVQKKEAELQNRQKAIKAELAEGKQKLLSMAGENKRKEQELKALEESLRQKEADLQRAQEEISGEKVKYLMTVKEMTGEIARLKITSSQMVPGASTDEVKRLKAHVASLTKSRAAVESSLNARLADSERRYKEIYEELAEKNQELSTLKSDLHAHAAQLFEKEKADYEKKINELMESADISVDDINFSSFAGYLKKREDSYENVEILNAMNKDIVSFQTDKGHDVKIIFGKLHFVDVSKKIKKKDFGTLGNLNSQNPDVKFFARDDSVVARQYFNKHISNEDLENIVIALADAFA